MQGQVSMFDIGTEDKKLEEIKYHYTTLAEYSNRDLLSMEKEMLGLYISGHPLEPLKQEIEEQTNINTLKMLEIKEQMENLEQDVQYKDEQFVKYAGIITKVKKKYTKKNTIMAFVTIEDLYGECEIIVFDNCYNCYSNYLVEDNMVFVDGKLSIREDDDIKIVASSIRPLKKQMKKTLWINVTNLTIEERKRLKGALRFFSGDRTNILMTIEQNGQQKAAGSIYLTEEILENLQEIAQKENVKIIEVE